MSKWHDNCIRGLNSKFSCLLRLDCLIFAIISVHPIKFNLFTFHFRLLKRWSHTACSWGRWVSWSEWRYLPHVLSFIWLKYICLLISETIITYIRQERSTMCVPRQLIFTMDDKSLKQRGEVLSIFREQACWALSSLSVSTNTKTLLKIYEYGQAGMLVLPFTKFQYTK